MAEAREFALLIVAVIEADVSFGDESEFFVPFVGGKHRVAFQDVLAGETIEREKDARIPPNLSTNNIGAAPLDHADVACVETAR